MNTNYNAQQFVQTVRHCIRMMSMRGKIRFLTKYIRSVFVDLDGSINFGNLERLFCLFPELREALKVACENHDVEEGGDITLYVGYSQKEGQSLVERIAPALLWHEED